MNALAAVHAVAIKLCLMIIVKLTSIPMGEIEKLKKRPFLEQSIDTC